MTTKTRTLKLASSKIQKYNHKTGEWYLEEDATQAERLGVDYEVSYAVYGGSVSNKLHSMEDAAMVNVEGTKNKQYYLNGIQYKRDTWKELLNVSKMDPLTPSDRILY